MPYFEMHRPSFLAENVDLAKQEKGSGQFVDVVSLDMVSEETAERVPKGFVLKQYRQEEYDHLWTLCIQGDDEVNVYTSSVADALRSFQDEGHQRPTTEEVMAWIEREEREREVLNRKFETSKVKLNRWKRESEQMTEREYYHRKLVDPVYTARVMEAWSYEGIAKRLRKRHETLKQFFVAHGLPDFIVPTQFFLGEGKGSNDPKQGARKHIYEIQPEVTPIDIPKDVLKNVAHIYVGGIQGPFGAFEEFSLQDIEQLSRAVSAELVALFRERLTPKQLQCIQNELAILVAIAPSLPRDLQRTPSDIFLLHNMLVTPDGFRCIDTNQSVPYVSDAELQRIAALPEKRRPRLQYEILGHHERYQRMVTFWNMVNERLSSSV